MSTLKAWLNQPHIAPFVPKLISCFLDGYSKTDFVSDCLAGITVGVISLPLAMALSIAVGLGPEQGVYTAVVAGILNALFGGSRYLIGGPTGAYVVLVFSVLQKHGIDGLVCATLSASALLVILGMFRCGTLVRFIPYPVIIGFTSGIALALLSTQIKDFCGLAIQNSSVEFVTKIQDAITFWGTCNYHALFLGIATLGLIYALRHYSKKLPGVIIAVIIATLCNYLFQLGAPTIETKFGSIPSSLPAFHWPNLSFELFTATFPEAIAIALLGAIESLLCAVIADSLTNTRHKSNCELIAQGIANCGSALFGGIPSTGAIARTTINIQLQAKTPVSALIHACTILVLMMILAPLASQIPLSAMAAVLVYVASNMFEFAHIHSLLKQWSGETAVMMSTLLITVFVDLTTAVQCGVLLAAILFLHRSSQCSIGKLWRSIERDEYISDHMKDPEPRMLPDHVHIYSIQGPLFFAVAEMLSDILSRFDEATRVLIIDMSRVPFVDATALQALLRLEEQCMQQGVQLSIAHANAHIKKMALHIKFAHTQWYDSMEQAVQQTRS